MRRTPKEELANRIRALQGRMASESIDAALIVQNADLLYFAGTLQQSFLFVPVGGEPLLFVRKNQEEAREESTLDHVIPVGSPRDLPAMISEKGYGKLDRLGMELDVLPVNHYFRFQKLLNPSGIVDIWPAVQAVRMIKSSHEINLLQEAAVLTDYMVGVARKSLREGMTEVELAGIIESAARTRGHQGMVRMRSFNQEIYWGYLVSGPDSAAPSFIDTTTGGKGVSVAFPSGAGLRVIGRNEPVIFDLVGVAEGYNSDETRTLCLGRLPEKLDRAYQVSLEILRTLEAMIRPGAACGDFFLEAERIAGIHGLGAHFMGFGKQKAGFCGHGIGIELDELPVLMKGNRMPLSPGMVFTIEPKFVFPGLGSVGVEDNFAVTEGGSRKLTISTYEVDITGC
jgi:Xaa-Pro dipeptidase